MITTVGSVASIFSNRYDEKKRKKRIKEKNFLLVMRTVKI